MRTLTPVKYIKLENSFPFLCITEWLSIAQHLTGKKFRFATRVETGHAKLTKKKTEHAIKQIQLS